MKRALREIYIWAFFIILLVSVVQSNTSVRSAFDFLIFLLGTAVKAGVVAILFAPLVFIGLRLEKGIFRRHR